MQQCGGGRGCRLIKPSTRPSNERCRELAVGVLCDLEVRVLHSHFSGTLVKETVVMSLTVGCVE